MKMKLQKIPIKSEAKRLEVWENITALPDLGETDGKGDPQDRKPLVKWFDPCGRGTWYAIEGQRQEDGDWLFFGYVQSPITPDYDEFGYFTLGELSSVDGPFGIGLEIDQFFNTERTLREHLA